MSAQSAEKISFVDIGTVPVIVTFRFGVAKALCGEGSEPVLYARTWCGAKNYESVAKIYKPGFPTEEMASRQVMCWNDGEHEGLSGRDCSVRLLGVHGGSLRYEVMARIVKST